MKLCPDGVTAATTGLSSMPSCMNSVSGFTGLPLRVSDYHRGFSGSELKSLGYAASEIKELGLFPSAAEMSASGCTAADLKVPCWFHAMTQDLSALYRNVAALRPKYSR